MRSTSAIALFIAAFLWLGLSPFRRGHILAPADFRVLNTLARLVRRLGVARIARTRHGILMHCDPADWIQAHIAYFGAWEPHVSGFILRRLGRDDTFVDIGANVGYYALLAARHCRQVIAIEAAGSNVASLQENVRLNGFRNIEVRHAAVAAADGEVSLYRGPICNAGGSTMVAARTDGKGYGAIEVVEGRRLQGLLTPDALATVRLIKIDIEGAERAALEQIAELAPMLHKDVEIIVEIDPQSFSAEGVSVADLVRRFHALGFTAYSIQNTYHPFEYIGRAKPRRPARLKQMPQSETDLVFSRIDADDL